MVPVPVVTMLPANMSVTLVNWPFVAPWAKVKMASGKSR